MLSSTLVIRAWEIWDIKQRCSRDKIKPALTNKGVSILKSTASQTNKNHKPNQLWLVPPQSFYTIHALRFIVLYISLTRLCYIIEIEGLEMGHITDI